MPRGDGFCLPKEWINDSGRGGSGCTLEPAEWCAPLGRIEAAEVVLTLGEEKVPVPPGRVEGGFGEVKFSPA